jgi:hypothetical protein
MANKKSNVNHLHIGILAFAGILLSVTLLIQASTTGQGKQPADKGFDEFGYNYGARTFNGIVDGADRNWDGTYWGDTVYANDKLKMTWSKGWDEARFNGAPWGPKAWIDNQWNGKNGGSGETWHYKIVWVGPELQDSEYWHEGGYPIWGEFEVIFSQGTVANEHFWDAHASPAGYGVFK